jgi:hypothetical protein
MSGMDIDLISLRNAFATGGTHRPLPGAAGRDHTIANGECAFPNDDFPAYARPPSVSGVGAR